MTSINTTCLRASRGMRACLHACVCARVHACMHASERASTRARVTWLVTVIGVADGAGGKQRPMHFGLHRRRVGLRRHLQPVVPRSLWCSHAPRTRGDEFGPAICGEPKMAVVAASAGMELFHVSTCSMLFAKASCRRPASVHPFLTLSSTASTSSRNKSRRRAGGPAEAAEA